MRIIAQPAKRLNGTIKELFDRPLLPEDVTIDSDGVTLSLIVRDIYSRGSNQRYTITLCADDVAMFLRENRDILQAAE